MMASNDNGDYLSTGEEEIEATMGELNSEHSIEKDAISMREGSYSRSPSVDSRPSSVRTGRKSDELVAGAEAISSDDDVEDGEVAESMNSSKSSPRAPPPKKQKSEPKEDLEDGEIESDSEPEEPKEEEEVPKPRPLITPPNRNVIRQQLNNNRPKIGFPRQQNNQDNKRRSRPEDFGICKFYLRSTCTWDDKCKYNHPTGEQKQHWLNQLGLPDPDIGYNPNRIRKSENGKPFFSKRRQNSDRSESRKSPRASPISSDGGSRSPSPKRTRQQSPRAVSVSSDDSRPASPNEKRKIRSSSSESSRSRTKSPAESREETATTLGALLRKRRLESQSKQSQEPSSFLPGNISDSDDDRPAPPKTRMEAVRRFFKKDPNDEPAAFRNVNTSTATPLSPTPQSITSSEDEMDRDEAFKSPSRDRSESPVPAEA